MEHGDAIEEESHDEDPVFSEGINDDDEGSKDEGDKSLTSAHEEIRRLEQ